MASNTETGHAVNLANFKLLIDKCTAFGVTYAPSNTDLAVANMTTLWTTANTSHQQLTLAMQNSKNPINAREILFAPVNKLVTKTLNMLNSTKASKQLKTDAKGLADKIRGVGKKVKKLPDGTDDPSEVSTSHQSFVQRADAFNQYVNLLKSEPLYAPTETELKTATLTTLATNMKTANDNIGTIIAPVETARVKRDKALYLPDTGMVDIAVLCKGYVKAIFGATSPEAKLVTGIRFRRPTK